MKCDGCGVESMREGFFRVVARSFSKRTLRLCPSCAAKHGDKEHTQVLWITVGIWSFALLVTWLTPEANLGPFVWNLGLFWVFLFPSTVAHELGHVITGRLAGMHITGIEIGRGHSSSISDSGGFAGSFGLCRLEVSHLECLGAARGCVCGKPRTSSAALWRTCSSL